MLKRLWSDHRNACLLTLTLLVIGVVVSPWGLLAAVLPVGWVLLKGKSIQLKTRQPTISEEEYLNVADSKERLIQIPDEIKDLLGSSDWGEVQQGLELLASKLEYPELIYLFCLIFLGKDQEIQPDSIVIAALEETFKKTNQILDLPGEVMDLFNSVDPEESKQAMELLQSMAKPRVKNLLNFAFVAMNIFKYIKYNNQFRAVIKLAELANCSKYLELEKIHITAMEGYNNESHFYDYCLDDNQTVRLQGTAEGGEYVYLTLDKKLIPYFLSTLNDNVDNGYGDNAATTALLSAVMHHADGLEIVDYGKDKRYFSPPSDASQAIAYIDGDEYKIFRDLDDYRWKNDDNIATLKDISSRFFKAYDDDELDYCDEYDDSCRRNFEFIEIDEFSLTLKSEKNTKGKNTITAYSHEVNIDRLKELLALEQPNEPKESQIGIVIQLNTYALFEELDYEGEIGSVSDLIELEKVLLGQKEIIEKLEKSLINLLNKINKNVNLIGLDNPEKIEVLISKDLDKESLIFFQSSHIYNYSGKESYKLDNGQWIPLSNLLTIIKNNSEERNRLIFDLLTADEGFSIRLPSKFDFIKGEMGCKFSEQIELDIELVQCLPLDENKYLTILQGYDHGEFETGIMNCGYSSGAYTNSFSSLSGTLWDQLGIMNTRRR